MPRAVACIGSEFAGEKGKALEAMVIVGTVAVGGAQPTALVPPELELVEPLPPELLLLDALKPPELELELDDVLKPPELEPFELAPPEELEPPFPEPDPEPLPLVPELEDPLLGFPASSKLGFDVLEHAHAPPQKHPARGTRT